MKMDDIRKASGGAGLPVTQNDLTVLSSCLDPDDRGTLGHVLRRLTSSQEVRVHIRIEPLEGGKVEEFRMVGGGHYLRFGGTSRGSPKREEGSGPWLPHSNGEYETLDPKDPAAAALGS